MPDTDTDTDTGTGTDTDTDTETDADADAGPRYDTSMTSTTGRDLGHGVRVLPGAGDGVVVLSERLDLGWRPREAGRPGSAVLWDEEGFEVVDRQPWRGGGRWVLEPWNREDVMRVVASLDERTVASVADEAREKQQTAGLRPVLWLSAPLLGFAVARWQRRWRDRWNYPAALATTLSALLELVVGAACMIELIAAMGAGQSIFPWLPKPLVMIGLYVFIEGAVRLAQVFSDSEPIGTLFGLVVSVVDRPRTPAPIPVPAPTVRAFDREKGTLDLLSPIQRRDWEVPGLLPYRGDRYAMERTERLGEAWVYSFHRVRLAGEHAGPNLRLLPARTAPEGFDFSGSPGVVRTVVLTIACTLAQARFQQRWADRLGVRAILFTVFGAVAELIGGLSNLGADTGASPVSVALNLFFVVEAAIRLGWVVLRGHPLGSVFGLVLSPILDHVLPEARNH
jgi:hypothetical protein